ncbi:MAG: dUTP diphosphatase [Candidatus Cloacimonetes bacterium HGW-Cloacimonetes-1]|nr:MAG: dUTP diphosphatase [Candidatus Cloacimonetes bacterium HGW-Cloacimonetes-1]
MIIKYIKLRPTAVAPQMMTEHAAGYDLSACLESPLVLAAGSRALVPTGLAIELPPGTEAQIRPRSGLAIKFGIGILNSPGTIDADYRGEIQVILFNTSATDFIVEPRMRIAQMIVSQVVDTTFVLKDSLSESSRQEGGFGHTGY